MRIAIVCSVAASVSLCSCEVTRQDAHDYVNEGVKAMDRQTRAQLAVAAADPDLDPLILSAAAQDFETQIAQTQQRFREIERRIEEQRVALNNLALGLINIGAKIGLSFVPGGDAVVTILSSLSGIFDQQQKNAAATAAEAVQQVEAQLQPLQELINKRPWEAQASEVAAKLTEMDHQYAMMKEAQRRELADQVREQVQSNAELQEDLLKNFRAEVDAQLASEKLDPETRKLLAELQTKLDTGAISLEEFLALLVAGGVPGAVAFRAWSKTNKPSRAADDVKDHERRLSKLEGETQVMATRQPTAVANAST